VKDQKNILKKRTGFECSYCGTELVHFIQKIEIAKKLNEKRKLKFLIGIRKF
jgi:hypothetical protein